MLSVVQPSADLDALLESPFGLIKSVTSPKQVRETVQRLGDMELVANLVADLDAPPVSLLGLSEFLLPPKQVREAVQRLGDMELVANLVADLDAPAQFSLSFASLTAIVIISQNVQRNGYFANFTICCSHTSKQRYRVTFMAFAKEHPGTQECRLDTPFRNDAHSFLLLG